VKVIDHDFGHEKRSKARQLRQLLDLDRLHELNVRDNPLPYLERASERIFQLERALFEARQALEPPADAIGREELVILEKAELDRLLLCAGIVSKAFEALVRDEPDD
jgi:hypothetical protein